jgi:type II secretory ATPase GspE/PulE/Tfp pilus assembly ATPase PilB-like protein
VGSIEKLVNAVLLSAVKKHAAAIRFCPEGDESRVDFEIAGAWHEEMRPPRALHEPMCKRLWVMAGLPYYRGSQIVRGKIHLRLDGGRHAFFEITMHGHGSATEAHITVRKPTLEEAAEEEPVVKLVNVIFLAALKKGAEKISMRRDADRLLVQFKLGEVWQDEMRIPLELSHAVELRLREIASLPEGRAEVMDSMIHLKIGGDRTASFAIEIRGHSAAVEVRISVLADHDSSGERPKRCDLPN